MPVVQAGAGGRFSITSRVEIPCTVIGASDDPFAEVQLLEAGAGLQAGDITVVPATELVPDEG